MKTTIEVWIKIDEIGDYACGVDRDQANDRYSEDIGNDPAEAFRMVKLTLSVDLPVVVELTGDVPAKSVGGTLAVAL